MIVARPAHLIARRICYVIGAWLAPTVLGGFAAGQVHWFQRSPRWSRWALRWGLPSLLIDNVAASPARLRIVREELRA